MSEIRAIVSGRVQGVMFRDFVRTHATRLSLTGFVRNLQDGSVEVVAQGRDDALTALMQCLHKGPLLSHVTKVDVEWKDAEALFDSFSIHY